MITKIYTVKLDCSEDGSGSYRDMVSVTDPNDAAEIAKTLEPYGFEGQFTRIEEVTLVSTLEEFKKSLDDKEKDVAMNKLTPKERKLLHLT